MVPDQSSPDVRDAVEELLLYLSDILPPLVVADTFKLLLKLPPSLIATHVREWTASQYRPGGEFKLSDYIYFAMRKINVIGEFRLVPLEPFERHLEGLKGLVLEFCPPAEREALRRNLTSLAERTGSLTGSVDALIRQKSGAGPGAGAGAVGGSAAATSGPPLSPEELRGIRRFSLLLEQIGRQRPGEGLADPGAQPTVLAQTIAAAARASRDSDEFEENMEKLRERGMEVENADIFRTLGSSLPGWVRPEPRPRPESAESGGEAAAAPPPPPAESGSEEAMHRIVAQPEDPAEVARRFQAMVKAAVERFNEGALPQAATMLTLAERIVAEERVDPVTVEAVKQTGDGALDLERMKKYSETQRFHGMLRRVLVFFRATSPAGLLTELHREMKRDRRKMILQLLEVHGVPARQEALERLRSPFGQAEGDEKWYFRRNLLYLLRRIPPDRAEDPSDEDVDTAVRHAVLRFPAPLVKEAVANLGQLKQEKAENALLALLDELEGLLIAPGGSPYEPREVRLLLDRVVAALARFGTARTRQAVVDHGLKKKAELGDPAARLSELAGQDLSGDPELVERLLAALKANAPHKVLGIVLHPNDKNARHIIEALSTTPSAAVREAFDSLARRFPDLEVGKLAASALAALTGAPRTADATSDTRSGELELYGFPALIQSLADSAQSGSLTLKDGQGEITSEIVLRLGKMKSCETGGLKGDEAFYQLLERPAPGSFVFAALPKEDGEAAEAFKDIVPLCLEGMRRYDELQQLCAVVPDDVRLGATEVRPERHPEELDGMFVNGLWKLASAGTAPRDCEKAMTADALRVRRQLAYWVEAGALTSA